MVGVSVFSVHIILDQWESAVSMIAMAYLVGTLGYFSSLL